MSFSSSRRIALLVAIAAVAAPAGAQGTGYANAGVSWGANTIPSGSTTCGGSSYVSGAQSAFCHNGPTSPGFGGIGRFDSDYVVSSSAYATAGSLGTSASVAWFLQRDDDFGSQYSQTAAAANSAAQWQDQAFFAPLPGAGALSFMDLTYKLTGSMTSVAQMTIAPGIWIGSEQANVLFLGNSAGGGYFQGTGYQITSPTPSGQGPGTFFTLRIGVTGLASDPFVIAMATSAVVHVNGGYIPAGFYDGAVNVDFSHTATPIGYALFDPNGNDVTNAYGVRFANGLTIGGAVTPTPEPMTVGLLGSALLVLGGAARVRRVKTARENRA